MRLEELQNPVSWNTAVTAAAYSTAGNYLVSSNYSIDYSACATTTNWGITANNATVYGSSGNISFLSLSQKEIKRSKLKEKLKPPEFNRCGLPPADPPEAKARELLRKLIGNDAFRKYLKDGFVMHVAKERKYQLFPGNRQAVILKDNKPVEKACIVIAKVLVPPTDVLITRLLVLRSSEEHFRKVANVMQLNPVPTTGVGVYVTAPQGVVTITGGAFMNPVPAALPA